MRDWRPGLINKELALSISKINSLDKNWVPYCSRDCLNEFAVTCQPSDLVLKMCP